MLDTISTLSIYAWVLLVIAVFIGIIIFGKEGEIDPATGLPIEKPSIDNTDIITCSVPGQKTIIFNPKQYQYYSIDSYSNFVEIQLVNGNICYLPSTYTTVIDESFNSVSEKTAI